MLQEARAGRFFSTIFDQKNGPVDQPKLELRAKTGRGVIQVIQVDELAEHAEHAELFWIRYSGWTRAQNSKVCSKGGTPLGHPFDELQLKKCLCLIKSVPFSAENGAPR